MNDKLLTEFGTFCIVLAETPKRCYKKCCLLCLTDESVCVPIALYLFQFAKKCVTTCDQALVNWAYSSNANHPHKNEVNLPFDATNFTPKATCHFHDQEQMCKVTLVRLFDFSKIK